jgi:hypothetical protein
MPKRTAEAVWADNDLGSGGGEKMVQSLERKEEKMKTGKRGSLLWAAWLLCAYVGLPAVSPGQTAGGEESVILDAGYYMQDFKPFATRLSILEKGVRYEDADGNRHVIAWEDMDEWQYVIKGRIGKDEMLEQEHVFRFNVPKDGSDRWLHFTFRGSVIEARNAYPLVSKYYSEARE